MNRVIRVKALPGHRLEVEFGDGAAGVIDLSSRLTGPMFAPLRDEGMFRQVSVDAFGAPCWPNGADLAPDALYQAIVDAQRAPVGA
jgi:Protein of unknown function (DUF2442)